MTNLMNLQTKLINEQAKLINELTARLEKAKEFYVQRCEEIEKLKYDNKKLILKIQRMEQSEHEFNVYLSELESKVEAMNENRN